MFATSATLGTARECGTKPGRSAAIRGAMLQQFTIAQPLFCWNMLGSIVQKAVQLPPAVECLQLPRMSPQMEHSAMKTHMIQHRLQAGHEISLALENGKQVLGSSPFATPDEIRHEHVASLFQYRTSFRGTFMGIILDRRRHSKR